VNKLKKFDQSYINGIKGWVFSKEEIQKAINSNKLLMLDFELGWRCSLNCGYCFRRGDLRDTGFAPLDLTNQKK